MSEVAELLTSRPRVRLLRAGLPDPQGGCVVYWMQRAQRATDNAALNLAIDLGNALKQPVLAVFGLTAGYPSAQRRHYRFLLDGLPEVQLGLERRNVATIVRVGDPGEVVLALAAELRPSIVVGDENPLHVGRRWRDAVAARLGCPFALVDADVVVPSSLFPREEYAARTIRPKIQRVLDEWLAPLPTPRAHVSSDPGRLPSGVAIEPDALLSALKVHGASEIPSYRAGAAEASRRLRRFVRERLGRYDVGRSEPTSSVTSELSAHLHFGQIGPLTIARAVLESGAPRQGVDVYLEELIVRRELAINFVARNPDYDRLEGCPDWALKTLAAHADDPRPVLYSAAHLEDGGTHDPLWNAAQKEMVLTGRMHNSLRMYWAKKILEWSPDAATAFATAVDLNDRYEMDGRDPNSYAGIAWAIGGKHDRPWPPRPIFGTVRSMSEAGLRKKIDAPSYIERIQELERGG